MNDHSRDHADSSSRPIETAALGYVAQHGSHGPEDGANHAGHAAVEQRWADAHTEHAGSGGHENHPAHHGEERHAGHGGHGGHGNHADQFRRLFWIMLVLAVPVIGFSGLFAMLLGYPLPDSRWIGWISPLLGTVMYAWGGRPF